MFLSVSSIKFRPLVGVCVTLCILLVCACQRKWYFSIVDLSDPSYPEFCFGLTSKCGKRGVSFDLVDVSEVDATGHSIRSVWAIQSVSNSTIGKVKYGTLPDGCKELMTALPLEVSKWYSANGEYFFRIVPSGRVFKAEVYDHHQFHTRQ